MITEWLYAGCFSRNVTSLYDTNYHIPVEPYIPLMEEAAALMENMRPREGEVVSLWNESLTWRYHRADPSETNVTWLRFAQQYAHMVVTYAFTKITAPAAGIYRFRLWLDGGIFIAVNGVRAFVRHQVATNNDQEFEVWLNAGENEFLICLANVFVNNSTNAFRLVPEDQRLVARAPLLLQERGRGDVEKALRSFYLRSPLVKNGESVAVCWDQPTANSGTFTFTVRTKRGEIKAISRQDLNLANKTGPLELLPCDQLPYAGPYQLEIDYIDADSTRVPGVTLDFTCLRFLPLLEDDSKYRDRCRHLLGHVANIPLEEINLSARDSIYRELARIETGAVPDCSVILQSIGFINERRDCADFALHGLIRLYIKHRKNPALDAKTLEAIKRCILDFKYAEDEPGMSMMYMRSENHRMLFYTAEHVAGVLFPSEVFTNSGQNGLFHALKGRMNADSWMKEKGAFGFEEWHSNCYFEEDLIALLCLCDFGDQSTRIPSHARDIIEFLCAIMASHTFRGVMATTHGRSYEQSVMYPETEAMSRINWLLFRQPKALTRSLSIGSVALAASGYVPSPEWEKVASDEAPLLTRTKMGFFNWQPEQGVNCSTYRTKHYMVSGVVESMKGIRFHQAQAGQVILEGNIPIFVTCFETKSSTATPSYWGGQLRMPKTITHRNVLAYIYNIEIEAGFTHCYFPEVFFDETAEANDWRFGRKGDAYVAVRSSKPCKMVRDGEYTGRELTCPEKRNTWILEAGSVDEWGSFTRFVEAISSAPFEKIGEDIRYVSPSIGDLELSWENTCKLEGNPVLEEEYPLIENSHASSTYGAGVIKLTVGKMKRTLSFLV